MIFDPAVILEFKVHVVGTTEDVREKQIRNLLRLVSRAAGGETEVLNRYPTTPQDITYRCKVQCTLDNVHDVQLAIRRACIGVVE